MSDLHVDFLGKRLAGPVIPASGTFGFGEEYADMYDLSVLGGICSKGLTLNGKYGNEGERLYETPAGLINSIGLQNPGVRHFIAEELPRMLTLGTAVFANLGGSRRLERSGDRARRPPLAASAAKPERKAIVENFRR